jgi:hypothetical protein
VTSRMKLLQNHVNFATKFSLKGPNFKGGYFLLPDLRVAYCTFELVLHLPIIVVKIWFKTLRIVKYLMGMNLSSATGQKMRAKG